MNPARSFRSIVANLVPVISHLKNYPSHSFSEHLARKGSGRFTHSLRVGYLSFSLAMLTRCDPFTCARAGVLHDAGYDAENLASPLKQLLSHAERGAKLAASIGEPRAVVEAIKTHMFPLGSPPRTREALIVWIADKFDALLELIGLTRILNKLVLRLLEAY
ncbi:MAG: HD domain-containing protein [Candidatus Jordarchaeales archaeon]